MQRVFTGHTLKDWTSDEEPKREKINRDAESLSLVFSSFFSLCLSIFRSLASKGIPCPSPPTVFPPLASARRPPPALASRQASALLLCAREVSSRHPAHQHASSSLGPQVRTMLNGGDKDKALSAALENPPLASKDTPDKVAHRAPRVVLLRPSSSTARNSTAPLTRPACSISLPSPLCPVCRKPTLGLSLASLPPSRRTRLRPPSASSARSAKPPAGFPNMPRRRQAALSQPPPLHPFCAVGPVGRADEVHLPRHGRAQRGLQRHPSDMAQARTLAVGLASSPRSRVLPLGPSPSAPQRLFFCFCPTSAQAVAKGGHGAIMRVLTDRKTV